MEKIHEELTLKLKAVCSKLKISNNNLRYEWEKHDKKNMWALSNLTPKQLWSYINNNQAVYLIDKYTFIDQYTNKRGKTFNAHFVTNYRNNAKYIGTVKKLGLNPILTKVRAIPNIHTHKIISTDNGCLIVIK